MTSSAFEPVPFRLASQYLNHYTIAYLPIITFFMDTQIWGKLYAVHMADNEGSYKKIIHNFFRKKQNILYNFV
jgi:hypothetical protein